MEAPETAEVVELEGRPASAESSEDAPGEAWRRPFRLPDAIVLIAYLALGMAAQEAFGRLLASRDQGVLDARRYALVAATWMVIASIALGCLALTGPGPGIRTRARRPGVLAVVMAGLARGYATAHSWIQGAGLVVIRSRAAADGPFWWVFGPIYRTAFDAGVAVAAGWLTLGLLGGWRASPDWLDRSGRVLGVGWIALGLLMGLAEMRSLLNAWVDRLGLG